MHIDIEKTQAAIIAAVVVGTTVLILIAAVVAIVYIRRRRANMINSIKRNEMVLELFEVKQGKRIPAGQINFTNPILGNSGKSSKYRLIFVTCDDVIQNISETFLFQRNNIMFMRNYWKFHSIAMRLCAKKCIIIVAAKPHSQ